MIAQTIIYGIMLRDQVGRRPGATGLAVGLLVGLAAGLFMGWVVWPVEWSGAFVSPAIYLFNAADLFAFNHDQARLLWALDGWDYQPTLCHLYGQAADEAIRWRLAMVQIAAGVNCNE